MTAPLFRFAFVLPVALVALSLGCKPGARDHCERTVKAMCQFQYGCCNAAEREVAFGQAFLLAHHDEATCVDELTRAYCSAAGKYADAEQYGRATWDYEAANECLSELESAASSCDAEGMLGSERADCSYQDLLKGAVEDDDTCYATFECANEEAVCVRAVADEEEGEDELITAKGTCTPPPGIGDECPDRLCTSAAFCDTSESPAVCKAKLENGESCSSSSQCESGVCGFRGSCVPKQPLREPCLSHNECASEYCDATAGECLEKRPNGAPCDESAACESGRCDYQEGECAAPPVVRYDICSADEQ